MFRGFIVMKTTAVTFTYAFVLITGMAVVAVFAYSDQAKAFTRVITHEDQSVGGCSGSGC